ncbi:MAG: hypothetical protein RL685_1168 [Pseudomonadota bacterium]|jgi:hypothetical protein
MGRRRTDATLQPKLLAGVSSPVRHCWQAFFIGSPFTGWPFALAGPIHLRPRRGNEGVIDESQPGS